MNMKSTGRRWNQHHVTGISLKSFRSLQLSPALSERNKNCAWKKKQKQSTWNFCLALTIPKDGSMNLSKRNSEFISLKMSVSLNNILFFAWNNIFLQKHRTCSGFHTCGWKCHETTPEIILSWFVVNNYDIQENHSF